MEYLKTKDIKIENKTIITIGNFDGVHLGHAKLINELLMYKNKDEYKNAKTTVLSFNPHPLSFILNKEFKTMFDDIEKRSIFENMGIDIFIEYPFDEETCNLSASQFVEDILIDKLNASIVVIGEDYCFGKNKEGNAKKLQEILKQYNVPVIIMPIVLFNGEKISSSKIRECLINGDMEKVTYFLNKPYFIIGNVCYGKQIGRTIGFPTMNILPNSCKLLPSNGVYISNVFIDNVKYEAVTNIGKNPTVNGDVLIFESHILGFDEDIYGKTVKVDILKKIRSEQKFDSLDKLKNQIDSDVLTLKNYIEINGKN